MDEFLVALVEEEEPPTVLLFLAMIVD